MIKYILYPPTLLNSLERSIINLSMSMSMRKFAILIRFLGIQLFRDLVSHSISFSQRTVLFS